MALTISLLLLSSIFSVSFCDDNTVQIGSASDLIFFSDNVNSGTGYAGITVLLTADIDFSEPSRQFTPIGNSTSRNFRGTFDGQGHTISNLAVSSSARYVGLFGYSNNVTIQNVVIDSTCSFTSSYGSSIYYSYVGSIIGECSSKSGPCVVKNSVNIASVTFEVSNSRDIYAGGVVGYLYPHSYSNYIKGCVNYGAITQVGVGGDWIYVGGIIGYTYRSSLSSYNYIQNCMNYGTITYSGTSSYIILGGIAGVSMYSSIDNCVSLGTISSNKVSSYIGAVVGDISKYTEVTHCYWADDIEYDGIGYIDSSALLSDNSAFSTTSFELNESVTVGSSTTTSLINALNAAADRYTLREYSHWLLNKGSRSVSFTVDNAKLSATLYSQIILLPSLAGRGSTVFRGWYTDSSCASLLTDYDYSGESDLSLYGKFEEDSSSHTITFDTRGGTSVSPITGQFGSVVTLSTDSTREHCEFVKWETEYGDAVPNEFTIPGQDVTLYAVWLCTHITTSNDLISFSNIVNSGTNFSGTTVFLDADIDFDGYSSRFVPVGTYSSNPFLGVFDGQGHTISNLALKSFSLYTGLFGYSHGTTIQNVVIDDTCSIVNTYVSSFNQIHVGSIIGKCLSTIGSCTIANSVNMASVVFDGNANENLFIGGIIGFLYSPSYTNYIRNCVNYGAVTQSGTCSGSNSWAEVGGIVGLTQSGTVRNYIQNCMNYGTVTHSGTSSSNLTIGGIAGYSAYSFIDNCVSSGAISSNQESNYIGAVVGYISKYTEVTHCYWTDDIGYGCFGCVASAVLLSNNSAFSATSFELSESVSVGSSTTTSLINALNAAADRYTLREYSHWLLNKGSHTVSFTVDNAKLSATLYSQIILLPSLASRGSTVFRGWYTDSSCTSLLTDYDYSEESDLSLYGKFEEDSNNYTITFDMRGGSSVEPITGQYGSVVTLSTDSTKWGYEFFRWETEYGDAVPNEFTIPGQDVTLYAVWLCTHITTPNDFISFSNIVNSGTDFSGTTVLLDADIDFSGLSEQFTPIGYFENKKTFNGVFNGQGHIISNLVLKSSLDSVGLFGYSHGTTIQNVVIDDSCSITSSYSSSESSETFYPYVGSILGFCYSTAEPCTISNSVNMASVTFSGEIAGVLFLGGVAGAMTSKTYPITISNCVNYGTVTQSGTCSFVAEMGGITGIAGENSSAYSYLQNCMNYGTIIHDGSSETLAIGGISGNIIYTTVENCVSSGVISTNKESDYIGTILGDITEYSEVAHCYWTSDVGSFDPYGVDESTGISFTNSSLVSLNQTIVAEMNEYAAKQGDTWSKWFVVHLDGGRINNITQESLAEIQGHFPDPVKEGNTFLSWCKDAGCNEVFDPKKDSVSGATDIYAAWTINTVTFDFDNGTTANETFSYGSSIAYPVIPEREGYILTWDNYHEYMPAKNITITAQWTPNNYTVTFDFDNGTTVNATFSYGSLIAYPVIPEREGYTFNGWDNMPDNMPAKNITITAQWTPNNYTVTFDFDNGTTVNVTFSYGSLIEYPVIPEREGYTLSWDIYHEFMPAENITITVQWTPNNYTVTFDFGNGTTVNETFSYGSSIEYLIISEREGYTFNGWNNYHEFMPAETSPSQRSGHQITTL